MTDFDIDNTRKTINALRAYYGAGPTAMTDEQIEAGLEVYGAKKHVDMVIVDEMDVLDYQGVRPLTAGQVRDAIEQHSMWVIGNNRCFRDGAYEEIADELNAVLGSGTCCPHYGDNVNDLGETESSISTGKE